MNTGKALLIRLVGVDCPLGLVVVENPVWLRFSPVFYMGKRGDAEWFLLPARLLVKLIERSMIGFDWSSVYFIDRASRSLSILALESHRELSCIDSGKWIERSAEKRFCVSIQCPDESIAPLASWIGKFVGE